MIFYQIPVFTILKISDDFIVVLCIILNNLIEYNLLIRIIFKLIKVFKTYMITTHSKLQISNHMHLIQTKLMEGVLVLQQGYRKKSSMKEGHV